MPAVLARLLGDPKFVDAHGDELKLTSRKASALLAFLIIESGRWHSREMLSSLLWGDHGATQARNSLNQALYDIRKVESASGMIIVERESERVRIVVDHVESDFSRVNSLLDDGDPIAAAELATSDLLEDFRIRDQDFIDWLSQKRKALRQALISKLQKLVSNSRSRGEIQIAIQAARHIVDFDPLDESARRQLMQLLAEVGNRSEAVRQYQISKDLLATELGVQPDPSTEEVLSQIKAAVTDPQRLTTPESIERQNMIAPQTGAEAPVVAVLPFTNLSDDPDFAYLAEGLADDILFSLSAFRWFKVLGRSSTFSLSKTDVDHKLIHQTFGATHLVNGQLRRSGKRLRISVELVDCRSGYQLWSARLSQRPRPNEPFSRRP